MKKAKFGVSKKLRDSARGRDCEVRLYPYCNEMSETVVLAHKNGGGMGMKAPDIHGAFCCSACHDIIDGRVNTSLTAGDIIRALYEGIFRTQTIWLREGLLNHA